MTAEGDCMSDPLLISEEFVFVIDTNSSSDFGSHLCAYCTGLCDEDTHSTGCSNMFYMEMELDDDGEETALDKNPFSESVVDKEMGDVVSPWGIWLNRNWGQDDEGNFAKLTPENYGTYTFPAPFSIGIFFGVEPTIEQIEIIKERAAKFFAKMWPNMEENLDKKPVEIEGFRLIKHTKYGEERPL